MGGVGDLETAARVIASLLAVVALALIASRLARRFGLRTPGRGIQVLERVGLNREASLAVIEVAGRGLVVGITAHSVNVVTELTGAEVTLLREQQPGGPRGRRPGSEPGRRRSPLAGRLRPEARPGARPEGRPEGRPEAWPGHRPGPGGVTVRELPDGAAQTLARLTPTDRPATPATAGTGSVLDPRTWRQGVEALRDLTARRR